MRYEDDFLLSFAGPRSEAEEIRSRLREFLRDTLKLELSEAKTLITHARTHAARFLGYEVVALHDDTKRAPNGARSINGRIGLKVPMEVIKAKCQPYLRHGKAKARPERRHDSDDFSIVAQFQAEYRVRALKALQPQRSGDKPEWVKVMAARQRKTLVVCRACHEAIHLGRPRQHAQARV